MFGYTIKRDKAAGAAGDGRVRKVEKVVVLPPLAGQKPILITRAVWDGLPDAEKRVWKDGTRVCIVLRTVGGRTVRRWSVVRWDR